MHDPTDSEQMIRVAFRASGRLDIVRIAGSPLPRRPTTDDRAQPDAA